MPTPLVDVLNPSKSFISLSHTAGIRLQQMGALGDDAAFADMKRVLIAAMRETGEIVKGTVETHLIAKIHISNAFASKDVYLVCAVAAGSPAGNLPRTTLIRGVMDEDDFTRIVQSKKGLTNLKHDPTIEKIGSVHAHARGDISAPIARGQKKRAAQLAPLLQGRDLARMATLMQMKEDESQQMHKLSGDEPYYDYKIAKLQALKWAIEVIASRNRAAAIS
jgi:hypothetical protein